MTRLLLFSVLALIAGVASAQTPVPIDQLYHQAWGLREGAPGAITGIAQTTDGYLWLAGPAGLMRFDGVRFEPVMPVPGDPLRRVDGVWAFADHSLWVRHDRDKLTVFRGTTRRTFTTADGLPDDSTLHLARDVDGAMWAAGRGDVTRLAGDRWLRELELDVAGARGTAVALHVDRAGALWVGGADRLHVRRRGSTQFETVPAGGASHLAEGPDGRLWALGDGVVGPGVVRALPVPPERGAAPAVPFPNAFAMHFDSRGNLWVGSQAAGLLRLASGDGPSIARVETVTERDGLTDDQVMAIFEDHEHNLWVGTAGGLDLFRETALTSAALPPMHAAQFAVGANGTMWVGAQNHPLLRVSATGYVATPVPGVLSALATGSAGTVWAAAGGALWHGVDGRFSQLTPTSPPSADRIWSLAVDAGDRLWGVSNRGMLARWLGDRWEEVQLPGLPALPDRPASIMADGARGLWLGLSSGAVARISGDRAQVLPLPTGPTIGALRGLADDGDRVWLARQGALTAVRGAEIRHIAGVDESTVGTVQGVARHQDGSLWLNAGHGVVMIPAPELERALADPSVAPRFRIFDYLDGVIGGAALRPPRSAIATPWGELWFVAFDRVLTVNPDRLNAPAAPPPVRIRAILAGEHEYAAADGLRLPVGTSTVRVAYTGLSLTMPDRVRFRHRLDGVDDAWQEAGARREVAYANLQPGTYTFRVIAANNNGVWPEAGAVTSFVVPPAFHQTLAFRLGLVTLFAGGLFGAYRLRVRQVSAEIHGRLAARVAERERIARELHDTLLQGVQGLVLRFQAVALRLPTGDPAARAMEDALSRADDVLGEARDRVRDLRRSAEAAADLAEALAQEGQAQAEGSGAHFEVTTQGTPRALHPIVRDEAFWIAHESIVNACRHARATHIEAEISYDADALRVRCRDNGRGMPAEIAQAGRPEHYGLRGMHERTRRIGGDLAVWSREGAGTEVELRVPASMAYADAVRGPARWWRQLAGGVEQ